MEALPKFVRPVVPLLVNSLIVVLILSTVFAYPDLRPTAPGPRPEGATIVAGAIEGVYDQVGCPEDMLGLWTYHAPWQAAPGQVNFDALYGFLGGGTMGAVA